MPDPITTITVGTVALYLADKIGGETAKEIGKSLWEKCKQLLSGKEIIADFAEKYDQPEKQSELIAGLEAQIKQNQAAQTELETLINNLPQQFRSNLINQMGNGNLALQDIGKVDLSGLEKVTITDSANAQIIMDYSTKIYVGSGGASVDKPIQAIVPEQSKSGFININVLNEMLNTERDEKMQLDTEVKNLTDEKDSLEIDIAKFRIELGQKEAKIRLMEEKVLLLKETITTRISDCEDKHKSIIMLEKLEKRFKEEA